MKQSKKILTALVLLSAISPIVYLLLVWGSMPETIITRFNFNEPIVKAQSKQTLLIATIIISITAAGVYLLLSNLKKIDPKVKAGTSTSGFIRLGLSLTIFLIVLNYFFILIALHSWEVSKKLLFIFFGLLIAVLGNYINNLRPNFFAGIRIPWTLSNENNWRLTHQLAGKIWFAVGILLTLISGILPDAALEPFFISTLVLIVLVPCIYSYRLFKLEQ